MKTGLFFATLPNHHGPNNDNPQAGVGSFSGGLAAHISHILPQTKVVMLIMMIKLMMMMMMKKNMMRIIIMTRW